MKKLMCIYKDEDSRTMIHELIAISESVDKLKARAIEHADNSVYDEVWNNNILYLSNCFYSITDEEPL